MTDLRTFRMPAEDDRPDTDRKSLWTIRELGLPAIVKACVSCRSTRHHPTGEFRVNANSKLLDVWMLICCDLCDRTSKFPVHERIHVQTPESARLLGHENNDPTMVRALTMDKALATRTAHQLDWSGTWELETDAPFRGLDGEDAAPLEVVVRFELPAPIRVEKLLTALDANAREDFTFFVATASAPPGGLHHREG